jgi:hypothetical protein
MPSQPRQYLSYDVFANPYVHADTYHPTLEVRGRPDILDESCKQPECRGLWHMQETVGRDEVHGLTVSDRRVAVGVGEQLAP